jgi:hypothetical protein
VIPGLSGLPYDAASAAIEGGEGNVYPVAAHQPDIVHPVAAGQMTHNDRSII